MKSAILVLLCLCSVRSLAQNGLYIMPLAGIGTTNVNESNGTHTSPGLHYTGQVNIGYQLNKWRLESGVRYFQTGYTDQETLVFESNFDPNGIPVTSDNVKTIRTFQHLAIPISIGYKLTLSKRISIIPIAGILMSYNTNATIEVEGFSSKTDLSQKNFDRSYNRYSTWSNLRLNATYKATPRLNVVAALQGDYMLSNLAKAAYLGTLHNYAASFNFGFSWSLSRA